MTAFLARLFFLCEISLPIPLLLPRLFALDARAVCSCVCCSLCFSDLEFSEKNSHSLHNNSHSLFSFSLLTSILHPPCALSLFHSSYLKHPATNEGQGGKKREKSKLNEKEKPETNGKNNVKSA